MPRLGKQLTPLLPLVLLLSFGLSPQSVFADPAIPLFECREQTRDQSGFYECLKILWQQSETTLSEIEQNWSQTLSLPGLTNKSEDEADSGPSGAVAAEKQAASIISPGVVAIVSGAALENLPANARVINLDEALTEKTVPQDTTPPAALFETLPVLFRQYRDQRCSWEAGILARYSTLEYQLACKIAINRQQISQLRRLLAEKNAADSSGESYRGYYLRTASGGNFQSCDRRQDWWVTGSDEVLQSLERRYDDIASENLEIVYAELRGRTEPPETSGPGSDFTATLNVTSLSLMRPILEQDCQPGSVRDDSGIMVELSEFDTAAEENLSDFEDIAVETTGKAAFTVDDLGDAGFLYGYFSNWNAACAVEQLNVCRAQTQAEFSSEGEWQIVVDRSSLNSWRVRLIPITENHNIEGRMLWSIDGSDKIEVSASESLIEVDRGLILASGTPARSMVQRFRSGQSVIFEWLKPDQSSATLTFSLVGITRALQYFNQAEK